MFLHGGSGRAARRRMNPVATDTKPASAGSRPGEPASAGFVLPAAGFSPPACGPPAERERHTPSPQSLVPSPCMCYTLVKNRLPEKRAMPTTTASPTTQHTGRRVPSGRLTLDHVWLAVALMLIAL